MFRFLCHNIIQRSELLNGDSKTFTLCFLKTPFLIRRCISASPDNPTDQQNTFTVSYLIHSCGLSPEKAISASTKVQFETSTKPDSVLTLFRNYEIPNTHISQIIQKLPSLLVCNADKTVQPKLEFFNSIGLSGPDLSKFLLKYPYFLKNSLENQIIPSFTFLKSILLTDSKIISMLQRSASILRQNLQKDLVPNIELLRAVGVPESNVSMLLVTQPRSLLTSANRFKEIVKELKKMDFDPLRFTFIRAIHVLTSLSESTRESKFSVYKKWGWSEERILGAFRAHPNCLMISEGNIMQKMEFLVNRMGFDPLLIAKHSTVLQFSMAKRMIPRFSVMKILISNGLVVKNYQITTILTMSNKLFLERFVTRFEKTVPELLNAYQGRMNGLD